MNKIAPQKPPVILLVDDSSDNLEVTSQVIQSALPDAIIQAIEQPAEVMDFLSKTEVDLAIVDVQMPGINGLELCREIKTRQDEDAPVPVLLITSHGADAKLKAEGLAAGADDFISRPLDNVELIARIKVALRIKQAEVKLKKEAQQTEEEYQRLFNHIPTGFALHEMLYDQDGTAFDYLFLAVNPAFEQLTGLSSKAVVGKRASQVFPDLSTAWLNQYRTVVDCGTSCVFEEYAAPLGKHFQVTAFALPDHRFANLFTDITTLKKQEQELSVRDQISTAFLIHQDENKLYKTVLDIARKTLDSPLGVFGYLENEDLLICPSMTTMAWDQCEMADKTISFPREKWGGQWGEALASGETKHANRPFKVPPGHVAIDCSMSTAIVCAGETIGLLQVANKQGGYNDHDVKKLESIAGQCAPILKARLEQQRAEKEQQQALNDYTSLYNNVPDMLVSVDVESRRIIQCNQAALDIMGYERHEIIGTLARDFYPPEFMEEAEKTVYQTFIKTGQVKDQEVILQRKDGSTLPATIDVSSIRDQQGKIISSSTVIHDISERKQLEKQMLLTAKMTTIASLAAGVAHEINTPLSGILQAMQLIDMGLDPQQEQNRNAAEKHGLNLTALQDYLKEKELDYFMTGIQDSAQKAARIINDLLRFSRPQNTTNEQVNINTLLDTSIDLARSDYTLKKKYNIANVQFERHYDANIGEIQCIPMEIEQVFINLIKNSCQAMAASAPAQPKITLSTLDRKEWVLIKLQDNGAGLPDSAMEHIFEPFFTTKDVGEGSGLGLSVCYSIIHDRHGGKITAGHLPDGGTLFKIQLPCKTEGGCL